MGYIVAVESDPKNAKDISEACGEVAKLLNLELKVVDKLSDLKFESETGETLPAPVINLLIIPIEELGSKPDQTLAELFVKYNCNIVVTLFDDISKPFSKIQAWPVQNFIYKPFDLMILKEHTRFALFPNTNTKTEFVHTTTAKGEIERLQKLSGLHLSEIGFKVEKTGTLNVGQVYKFYHPLFLNGRKQHILARLIHTDDMSYEFIFSELNANLLLQIRKRISGNKERVKNAAWRGRESVKQDHLNVVIQLNEADQIAVIQDLLERNFDNLTFKDQTTLAVDAKNEVDLLITSMSYNPVAFETMFPVGTVVVNVMDHALDLPKTLERFAVDTIRMEKTIDRAFLVKVLKQLFPQLKEKEPSVLTTIPFMETITLTESMEITEFSEAAIGFKSAVAMPLNLGIDICLPQEDETNLKEMKARVHYVDATPDSEKFYYHQLVLFGMKDEFLKLIRLWSLEKHILANKAE